LNVLVLFRLRFAGFVNLRFRDNERFERVAICLCPKVIQGALHTEDDCPCIIFDLQRFRGNVNDVAANGTWRLGASRYDLGIAGVGHPETKKECFFWHGNGSYFSAQ
jgi:hypothetical protein